MHKLFADDYRIVLMNKLEGSVKSHKNYVTLFQEKFLSQTNLMMDLLDLSRLVEEQYKVTLFYMIVQTSDQTKTNMIDSSKGLIRRALEDLKAFKTTVEDIAKENNVVKVGVLTNEKFVNYIKNLQVLVEISGLIEFSWEILKLQDKQYVDLLTDIKAERKNFKDYFNTYKATYKNDLKEIKFERYLDAIYDIMNPEKSEDAAKSFFCQLSMSLVKQEVVPHGGKHYLLPCFNYWVNRCNINPM